jgi:hypothetical protein
MTGLRVKLHVAAALAGLALSATAIGQVTQRVSLSSSSAQGNALSFVTSGVTPDGRLLVFFSDASNLVAGDTNSVRDIFLRDRRSGATELVSVDSKGEQGNSGSNFAVCSADGRYVAFFSFASNLVPGDTNGEGDCFVRDRVLGTTERVSVDSNGIQGDGMSRLIAITPDGRFLAFESDATNLVPLDTNGFDDVFVHDRRTGVTERVSVGPNGVQGNHESNAPRISDDGRFVSFRSRASNLIFGDSNNAYDAFVRDRLTAVTQRVSVAWSGGQSNPQGDDYNVTCGISGDGRFAIFTSRAGNLVPGDSNDQIDLFLRDRIAGTTERVSIGSDGTQGDDDSYLGAVSADGRFVVFPSFARNLVPGGTILGLCYLRDRVAGTTTLVSVDSHGTPANGGCLDVAASITPDGRFVTFDSWASNLVPGDTNGFSDVYIHDRAGRPDFESLCDPGVADVIECPCLNSPSGPARGCDNSSATGGAGLTASGGTFLSSDSLVLTTEGEGATAMSILLQGNGFVPTGTSFGQGVRCVGGTIIRRLFTKAAVGGSISVPDYLAGEPTLSARSLQKGDPILPGESRWYLVYYRDATVLGGCPATSTFNTTLTGQVTWSP